MCTDEMGRLNFDGERTLWKWVDPCRYLLEYLLMNGGNVQLDRQCPKVLKEKERSSKLSWTPFQGYVYHP